MLRIVLPALGGGSAPAFALLLQQGPTPWWLLFAAVVVAVAGAAASAWSAVHWLAIHVDGERLVAVLAAGAAVLIGGAAAATSLTLLGGWRQDEDCARYRRIATGGDVPGATSLTELTNSELRERALGIVGKMRTMERFYSDGQRTVQQRRDSGELPKDAASKQIGDIWKQCGRDFEDTLRSDMELTLWELRNRLPDKQWKQAAPGVLPLIRSVVPGGQSADVGMALPSEFCMSMLPLRAQELERLAKLLPN